jgi:hypothetical protein
MTLRWPPHLAPRVLAPAFAATLAACGGEAPPQATAATAATAAPNPGPARAATAPLHAAPAAAAARQGSAPSADPRCADVGPARAPDAAGAIPPLAGAAEAERLAAARCGAVVWVQVACCGEAARELAVLAAFGQQAAQELGDHALFIVHGERLEDAADVVDRLTIAGHPRVMLVGP